MTTICFTGHRDCVTTIDALDKIHRDYPDALWIQGGAPGFDAQVLGYCKTHGIPHQTHRPDYKRYEPKRAPLIRDEWMVDLSSRVVACYDGRTRGGTFYTRNYAIKQRIIVIDVPAIPAAEVVA